ncbi:pyridoxal phosphate-dependent aminotransferase [Eggerthellaceae bacterium zg-1084]|uniref:pyridoxal phosphate-dependent aminotransferase n=1 Tax=Berryella wangjianweii TaxID=2734634 RepID=UPI001554E6E5|nr:pyridoxal phosphate-dependent aminotransferase [Berryella wangjianweii]NPD31528.1 pyridoxal phosphate-dependent aminotransferase [Berryella wangjianweii]NPD32977.1 pyridoxal phosphate-dependent aminotransferase [Eggerthellaceae bacterium zg-997]
MINPRMLELGKAPSTIRELFAYGQRRKQEVGAHHVFDLSIGNPSTPTPAAVTERMRQLLSQPAETIHGYTNAPGIAEVRAAVARNLNERFDAGALPQHVYMTCGAYAALAVALRALTVPGDQVVVNAPYFPEYRVLAEAADAQLVEVPTVPDTFQLDLAALDAAIGPRTSVVIVNSPNNPVGAVYAADVLQGLGDLLRRKSAAFGHPVFLLSDEPYRELSYDAPVPFPANFYDHTVVCYSWAKSLSLPGERIGYAYASSRMDCADEVMAAIAGAGRALGFVNAPVLFQRVMETCIDCPPDLSDYARNRTLLTEGLARLGYEFVHPDGAFYLWVRALEPDAEAFSARARELDLLIVPSNSFGCEGWVRCSYCVSSAVIERSMAAWEALKRSYE